jgi:hypothetical protein
MDHVISANKTRDIEVHSKWLDWAWLLGELFQQPEKEVITNMIQRFLTQISGEFNADQLHWP